MSEKFMHSPNFINLGSKTALRTNILLTLYLGLRESVLYLSSIVVVPVIRLKTRAKQFIRQKNIGLWAVFFITVYIILIVKLVTIREFNNNWFFGTYSVLITVYILSRFLVAYFYQDIPDNGYQPSVTFVVPAYNEEEAIQCTLRKIFQVNYPPDKLEVITINDGSRDKTLTKMLEVKKDFPQLNIVSWQTNRGKRHGMAEGAKKAKNEIIIFIDSDSFIEPDSIYPLIKYFKHKKVAAVAGHADVANANQNLITKMQAVRYYIAFVIYKGVESIFNSV